MLVTLSVYVINVIDSGFETQQVAHETENSPLQHFIF